MNKMIVVVVLFPNQSWDGVFAFAFKVYEPNISIDINLKNPRAQLVILEREKKMQRYI